MALILDYLDKVRISAISRDSFNLSKLNNPSKVYIFLKINRSIENNRFIAIASSIKTERSIEPNSSTPFYKCYYF